MTTPLHRRLKTTKDGAYMVADWLEKDGLAPVVHHHPPLWSPKPKEVPPALRSIFKAAHVPVVSWKIDDADLREGTPLTDIDANAAFLAACSSTSFGHCALQHTGPLQLQEGAVPPGYLLVDAHKWQYGVPGSPLGADSHAQRGGKVWVPHTVYEVLRDLAYGSRWTMGGYWPDATVYDSWTSVRSTGRDAGKPCPCRFYDWYTAIRDVRAAFVRTGMADDEKRMKLGYSQAIQMWAVEPGEKKPNKAWRPDWYHALRGQHMMNMWRRAWQATLAGLPPVQVSGTGHYMDGMVFCSDDLKALLKEPKGPIRLDETRESLGTFRRIAERYAGIEGQ